MQAYTCVQLSNTHLSATLTTATFPTAAACREFDACACTPTPRDLLSSHWQLRLHLIWKVANPLYIDVHLVAHGQVRKMRHIIYIGMPSIQQEKRYNLPMKLNFNS